VKNHFDEIGPEKTRIISGNHAEVSGLMMKLITIIMPGCFEKQPLKFMGIFRAFAETGANCRESAK